MRGFSEGYRGLQPSGKFADFLAARKINWNQENALRKLTLFEEYFQKTARRYEDPELLDLETIAGLSESLRKRGYDSVTEPKQALRLTSARNRDRILAESPCVPNPGMRAAEEAVDKLELRFVQNTRALYSAPVAPIVSSRQMENAGFPGGLNTRAFPRKVLASDDQVFFKVAVSHRDISDKELIGLSAEYGDGMLVLDNAYAAEHGWVSPFIMRDIDLMQFAETHSPENHEGMAKLLIPNGYNFQDGNPPTVFTNTVRTLHNYDFVSPDFEKTAKQRMLSTLERLRETDPDAYKHRLSQLTGKDVKALNEAFNELLKPWLGTNMAELKAPVAVPPTQLKFYRSENRAVK